MYEPGSVFKSMVIASGIDSGEVTPFETYEEYKPLKIDTGTGQFQFIRNALNKYRGIQTVTQALEQSSNLGLAYVARKMGKQVFYSYLENFGFGELTYIDLAEEQRGRMSFWKTWPEAQLITTSFGQGISVTPLQMVSALSALANGGVLMQPKIISERILPTGERKKESPRVIRRVISEDTSAQMTAMLVSSIANGVAWGGGVKGYALAGKTGTAQIACTDATRCEKGKYETGTGSTVTSFGGYGPASHPRFVILVNFERPRYSRHGLDDTWGSTTSAPVFREIAEFILSYYDIPPEK
jgi:cell division protein FtsI/penicillin-binding protein 2